MKALRMGWEEGRGGGGEDVIYRDMNTVAQTCTCPTSKEEGGVWDMFTISTHNEFVELEVEADLACGDGPCHEAYSTCSSDALGHLRQGGDIRKGSKHGLQQPASSLIVRRIPI